MMGFSRQLFEGWLKEGDGAADLHWDEQREQYTDYLTDAKWEAWQGALESVNFEFPVY